MPNEPALPPPTVLVVDDDPGIRESVTEVLTAEGYRVLQAADGAEALLQLSRFPGHCVVLLDLAMPRMNGLELLAELSRKGRTHGTPVLVMSANAHPGELDHPQVVALLRKPFELEELLRWVEICAGRADGASTG